jgi:hypothetical protein
VDYRMGYFRPRLGAMCVLMIACALVPASATQNSNASSSTKKPATTKKHSSTKKSTTSSTKTAASKPHAHPKTASSTSAGIMRPASSKKSLRKKKSRPRGQQKIDSERAQEIQQALIREHYLTGEATGTWNDASEAAMRRYQADNGWQSKTVPDSRALIKLGLGPSKDHLLNPESAMTTVPDRPKAASIPPTSHSTAPVASPATPAPASTPISTGSSDPQ